MAFKEFLGSGNSVADTRIEEMNFQFKRSGHLGVLIVNDDMTTDREGKLKEALMITIDNVDHLLIYFEKLTVPTLSLVHLLCSSYRYCKKFGKRLTLIGRESDVIKQAIHDHGLVPSLHCLNGCYSRCLWQ